MYTQLSDVPKWLSTQPLPMSSSAHNSAGCQSAPQSSSPLQLTSPCTPSSSTGSVFSSFSGMPCSLACSSFPPDPFYNQPPMDFYQPLIDDYYNMPYHPTTRCVAKSII